MPLSDRRTKDTTQGQHGLPKLEIHAPPKHALSVRPGRCPRARTKHTRGQGWQWTGREGGGQETEEGRASPRTRGRACGELPHTPVPVPVPVPGCVLPWYLPAPGPTYLKVTGQARPEQQALLSSSETQPERKSVKGCARPHARGHRHLRWSHSTDGWGRRGRRRRGRGLWSHAGLAQMLLLQTTVIALGLSNFC